MFLFVLFYAAGDAGVYVNPIYFGVMEPIQDTAGIFSTNEDDDAQTEPRNLTTNLNPT